MLSSFVPAPAAIYIPVRTLFFILVIASIAVLYHNMRSLSNHTTIRSKLVVILRRVHYRILTPPAITRGIITTTAGTANLRILSRMRNTGPCVIPPQTIINGSEPYTRGR